jgi:hypothetical protein
MLVVVVVIVIVEALLAMVAHMLVMGPLVTGNLPEQRGE